MKPNKKELTLAESALTEKQILHIMQKTPADHIYQRSAKGGGTWDYVTGVYVKKVLNYAFGWNWDFLVKEHGKEGDTVWVLGELVVRTEDGKEIRKNQFGRADLKKRRDGTGYLDFGNDLKAATTDALKKCASELGIASDIYGAEEFKEIKLDQIKDLPNPKTAEGMDKEIIEKKNNETINKLNLAEKRRALENAN